MAPDNQPPDAPTKPDDQALPSFDLERLRLPQNFADTVGVKRRIVSITVRKPHRQEFVRVRPGQEFYLETAILTEKNERDSSYLVAPELWTELLAEITPVKLMLALSRQGAIFLWPLRLPRSEGRQDNWSASALEGADLAQKRWISVRSNMAAGCYEVFEARGDLGEPDWPDLDFDQAIKLAFQDRWIDTAEHPVLRRLRGEA